MESIAKYKNFIAAVVVIAVFAWVTKAMISDYTSKKAVLKNKQEAIAKEKELVDRWLKSADAYSNIAARFFRKDPSLFKRFVEDSAQSNNIAINALSTTKNEETLLIDVKLTIHTQSSYRNFLRFIKAVEEKNISVERLAISKPSAGNLEEEDIILKTLVLKE